VKKLRTDNGLEFCSGDFNELCTNHGIARHKTIPRNPQQNGVVERMNMTLLERVRCMLSNVGLWHRRDLWAEAASIACYLVNRSPHSALDFKVPEEIWLGNPVDYSNLNFFGCPAYAHVNNGKLAPRFVECIFLGYASRSKGYRLWCSDPKFQKLILSRDVTFNEDALLSSGKQFFVSSCTSTGNLQSTSEKVEFVLKPATPNVMSHLLQQMNPTLMTIMLMMSVMIVPFLLFNNKEMITLLPETEPEDKSESQPDTLIMTI